MPAESVFEVFRNFGVPWFSTKFSFLKIVIIRVGSILYQDKLVEKQLILVRNPETINLRKLCILKIRTKTVAIKQYSYEMVVISVADSNRH